MTSPTEHLANEPVAAESPAEPRLFSRNKIARLLGASEGIAANNNVPADSRTRALLNRLSPQERSELQGSRRTGRSRVATLLGSPGVQRMKETITLNKSPTEKALLTVNNRLGFALRTVQSARTVRTVLDRLQTQNLLQVITSSEGDKVYTRYFVQGQQGNPIPVAEFTEPAGDYRLWQHDMQGNVLATVHRTAEQGMPAASAAHDAVLPSLDPRRQIVTPAA